MAVLVNKQLGFIVEGGYRASADIKPGQFVTVDYETKEATVATNGKGVKLVLQRNDTIDQEAVADSDVVYKKGEFLPLRTLQVGDVITSDQFTGTYADITVGSDFKVGANGQVVAGASDGGIALVVKDKTTLFGNPALKLEVVAVEVAGA